MNMKVTFLYVKYMYQLTVSCYSFIFTVEKILDFPFVVVSLKLHDEILPVMYGRHTMVFTCPSKLQPF